MILRTKDHNRIVALFRSFIHQPSKLLAFGSRVSGEAHDTSDLDLVIISKESNGIDGRELMAFQEALQKSNIPILVQLFDWHRIPDSFHQNIMADCVTLCETD